MIVLFLCYLLDSPSQFREAKALNDAIKRLEGTAGKDKTPSNQTGINHSLHVHVHYTYILQQDTIFFRI